MGNPVKPGTTRIECLFALRRSFVCWVFFCLFGRCCRVVSFFIVDDWDHQPTLNMSSTNKEKEQSRMQMRPPLLVYFCCFPLIFFSLLFFYLLLLLHLLLLCRLCWAIRPKKNMQMRCFFVVVVVVVLVFLSSSSSFFLSRFRSFGKKKKKKSCRDGDPRNSKRYIDNWRSSIIDRFLRAPKNGGTAKPDGPLPPIWSEPHRIPPMKALEKKTR